MGFLEELASAARPRQPLWEGDRRLDQPRLAIHVPWFKIKPASAGDATVAGRHRVREIGPDRKRRMGQAEAAIVRGAIEVIVGPKRK